MIYYNGLLVARSLKCQNATFGIGHNLANHGVLKCLLINTLTVNNYL